MTCHFGPKNLDSEAGGSTRVAKCQSYGRYTFVKKDWKVGGGSVGGHAYFTRFVRDRVNKERTLKGQADREGWLRVGLVKVGLLAILVGILGVLCIGMVYLLHEIEHSELGLVYLVFSLRKCED